MTGPATPDPTSPDPADALLQAAIEDAALRGPFDPLHLLASDLDPHLRVLVLRRLGASVDEVVVGGLPLWVLKSDLRLKVLSGLANAKSVQKILGRSPTRPDDPFALALKSALTGPDTPALPGRDLDDAYAARTFAKAAPYAARRKSANPETLRRQIAADQAEARRRIVLPMGLYGRDDVRATIAAFLRTASAGPTKALLVTGLGGIGKSALIAAIIADAAKSASRQAVIVLDFDRPNLFGGDRIEIAREITRQLGQQWPKLEQTLAQARAAFPGVGPETDATTYFAQLSVVLAKLREALVTGPKASIAVFLDTFEEVIVRGETAVKDVLDWMQTLRSQGGLAKMAVVVSGRSAPNLAKDDFDRHFTNHIDLPGLSPQAGGQLLREDAAGKALFTVAQARLASKALKGHPQALRLLKLYGATHPDEIAGIVQDGLRDPNFGVQFAQVFLYTRILGRIRDAEVRKLAHPGLVLRRVTPGLIADVLAMPCGFEPLDPAAAQRLFDKLAATVWIVDHTERPDVVTHRRELRRLMLPAMNAPDPRDPVQVALGQKAQQIHQAAADWYAAHRDTTLGADLQDIEAFYHRASIAPDTVDLPTLQRCAGALGEDIADLPPQVQALAKFAQGRTASMTEAERNYLPADLREQLSREQDLYALRRGQTAAVKRRVTAQPEPPESNSVAVPDPREAVGPTGVTMAKAANTRPEPQTFSEAERLYGTEIQALWAEGDFDGVVATADQAFGALWPNGTRERVIEISGDPVFSALWKGLLARVATGVWPAVLGGPDALEQFQRIYGNLASGYEGTPSFSPYSVHLAGIILAHQRRPDLPEPQRARFFAELRSLDPLDRFNPSFDRSMIDLRRASLLPANLRQTPQQPTASGQVPASALRLLTAPYVDLIKALDQDPQNDFKATPAAETRIGWLSFGRSLPNFDRLHTIRLAIHGEHPSLLRLDDVEHLRQAFEVARVDVALGQMTGVQAPRDLRFLQRLSEVLDPVMNALAPLFATDDGMAQLLHVGQQAALWPEEMTDLHRLSPTPDTRALAQASVVQIADQADLLPELLQIALTLTPGDKRLGRVAQLVTKVEGIFNHRETAEATPSAPLAMEGPSQSGAQMG